MINTNEIICIVTAIITLISILVDYRLFIATLSILFFLSQTLK